MRCHKLLLSVTWLLAAAPGVAQVPPLVLCYTPGSPAHWRFAATGGSCSANERRVVIGASCWDLDADMVPDLNEDRNGDNSWDSRDCAGPKGDKGTQGPPGPQGPVGPANGLSCWDADGDRVQDAAEDVNGDGRWDASDCRGPRGPVGPPGRSCWDLNGNGVGDVASEDLNGDGAVSVADCRGPQGPSAPALISCREVRFPASQQQFGYGSSTTAACGAGELAVSASCGSAAFLKVIYPDARSAGCECFLSGVAISCVLEAGVGVVRCCR